MILTAYHLNNTIDDTNISHLTISTTGLVSCKLFTSGTQTKCSILPVLLFLQDFQDTDI